ncbi:decapping nuclease DXO homolog [Bombyx mandarina]|uniref:Decapping nuclease n=1 Tax=Bombyx mandarina TaxID=7092 RepID=A0A6J2K7G3_BOMMA|nr:decapping nuclease DXO homolog [Bombyx mandarina]
MQIQPELHVNASIYSNSFPRFDRPKVIGYIGLHNLKFCKTLRDKKVCFDLNLHLDKVKRKPVDRDVKLDDLLHFLLTQEHRLNFPIQKTINDAPIHCYRGLMTCVACTPYENTEPWKIVAILHKGNIYLCARDTDEKKSRNRNMSEKDKQFTSWGFKFEQFMTSDHPEANPNPDVPVDETEEFSLVLTTKLNNHKIIYGAEMDAIRCDKVVVPSPPSNDADPQTVLEYLCDKEFIELKTNRHIENNKQEINFRRYKCKKWWCQSFLVGVDTILCGFRNDKGIVEELKVFTVKELSKQSKKYWSGNVCFNFLDTFFTYVKRCLIRRVKQKYGEKALTNLHNLPLVTLLFEWNPEAHVQVNEAYTYEDDPILPELFIKNYGSRELI